MIRALFIAFLLFPTLALADISLGTGSSLGVAASNINQIVAFIYNVLDVILYIGAAIMGMSGFLKYRLHRRNPQQVPLSTPVTELALAGVFILLAVLAQLSASYQTVENPGLPNTTVSPAPAPSPYPY